MSGIAQEINEWIIHSINIITFGKLDRDNDLKEDILDILKMFKLLVIYIGILGLLVSFSICNISYLSFLPFINLINIPVIQYIVEYILLYIYTNIIIYFIGDNKDAILPSFMNIGSPYVLLFIIYKSVPLLQISNIMNLLLDILNYIPVVNKIPINLIKNIIKYIIMAVLFILTSINLTSIGFLKKYTAQKLITIIGPPSFVITALKATSEFSFLK